MLGLKFGGNIAFQKWKGLNQKWGFLRVKTFSCVHDILQSEAM